MSQSYLYDMPFTHDINHSCAIENVISKMIAAVPRGQIYWYHIYIYFIYTWKVIVHCQSSLWNISYDIRYHTILVALMWWFLESSTMFTVLFVLLIIWLMNVKQFMRIWLLPFHMLTHCGHMVTEIWVNIRSGNVLLPDSTKPLPEPMWLIISEVQVTFILEKIHKRCLNCQSLKSIWKLHI